MNIDEALIAVQDFRSKLELWGVSSLTLILAGTIASVVFFFSLREVFMWYFKIHALRSEIREVHQEVKELKETLKKTQDFLADAHLGEDDTAKLTPETNPKATNQNKFRFDH